MVNWCPLGFKIWRMRTRYMIGCVGFNFSNSLLTSQVWYISFVWIFQISDFIFNFETTYSGVGVRSVARIVRMIEFTVILWWIGSCCFSQRAFVVVEFTVVLWWIVDLWNLCTVRPRRFGNRCKESNLLVFLSFSLTFTHYGGHLSKDTREIPVNIFQLCKNWKKVHLSRNENTVMLSAFCGSRKFYFEASALKQESLGDSSGWTFFLINLFDLWFGFLCLLGVAR